MTLLIIETPAGMDQSLDSDLRRLLALRFRQLGDAEDAARFHVVEPGDGIAAVAAAIGFPLTFEDDAPSWDWAERHGGGWIEVAFILSDDGPADVLLVQERDDTNAALIALLHLHATDDLEQQHATAP